MGLQLLPFSLLFRVHQEYNVQRYPKNSFIIFDKITLIKTSSYAILDTIQGENECFIMVILQLFAT